MALIKYKLTVIDDPPRDLDDKKPTPKQLQAGVLFGCGSLKDIAKLYPFKPETLRL